MRLSIIMPCYNEEQTVAHCISRILEEAPEAQLVVVDDASSDGTWDVLSTLANDTHIVRVQHAKNMGKGAAIRTALEHVTGDIVLIQDADLEYDPSDYSVLLGTFSFRPGSGVTTCPEELADCIIVVDKTSGAKGVPAASLPLLLAGLLLNMYE